MKLRGMAITAIENKGGGVTLVSAPLAREVRKANTPESRYGLSGG
jgi:hypothetical protein